MKGIVIKSYGDTCKIKVSDSIYRCKIRGKHRLKNNFSNPIVSGDFVDIILSGEKGYGIIEKIYERKNYFIKKSIKENKGHLIGSNIDQVIIIFSIKNPYTKLVFLDKCLSASKYYKIKPIILFNKIDLLDSNEKERLEIINNEYKKLGFFCISVSAKFNIGMDKLKLKLKNKQSLILGNSGVGKSTIINRISSYSNQKTDSLSSKTGRGKQTTTFSEMFKIDNSTTIIDTPGFKDFNFFQIEKNDIKYLYPEFEKKFNNCKFSNCTHTNEPNCSIKDSIGNDIWERRYKNYLLIVSEFD
ncbi:MAG: ribosome small subunit-dependent GTPase A [Bacteroidota bacterium]|nr:ribosome small subunit-dependent GTPase A [Bacteroidota bacterium]